MKTLLLVVLLVLPWLGMAQGVPLEVTRVQPQRAEVRVDTLFTDFGQDAYGTLELTFRMPPPAGEYTVRLGEKLSADGTIDRKPPGSVNYREIELVPRDGKRVYKLKIPGKPAHQNPAAVKMPLQIGEVTPFRYAEVEGPSGALTDVRVVHLAVHAPFNEATSDFESSDPTLNAVWKLCKHTMEATTAFGIYIDGERERTPYEADTYINLLSHYACDLDPRVAHATFGHLLDHPTWPTEWGLQMPTIAEADYEATGDIVLAKQNYDTLKSRLLARKTRADGLLVASAIVDWPASERDGYNGGAVDPLEKRQIGPMVNTVANAFYFRALESMSRLAAALGKQADATVFSQKADHVYAAFNSVFFDSARCIYIDGEGSPHASLHANMFPLASGLVPKDREKTVADFVESRGMACSVYGAQYLLEALYQSGRADAALALLTSHSMRSWWHMLELGSTLTLEAWDPMVKPNLTWNHAWGSAPANIIARYVLGVRPLAPGYSRTLIAPHPGNLVWMRGKVPTPRGPIEVGWQGAADRLDVEIPLGITATIELPPQMPAGLITVNGKPVKPTSEQGHLKIESLPSGRYTIVVARKGD
ncbi:MAG TPA: alpha-L-rhamnosidase C-terminal domain-containing protein [Chthoniobacterales bacterium]